MLSTIIPEILSSSLLKIVLLLTLRATKNLVINTVTEKEAIINAAIARLMFAKK